MNFKSITEVKQILRTVCNGKKQVITPILLGYPGIGKSELIYQLAKELQLTNGVIDFRASQHEAGDLKVPKPNEHITHWLTPDFIPTENNPKFKDTSGILFLDEINSAQPDIIPSLFQLIYDRRIGDHKILDAWIIVAAGNLGYEDGNDHIIEFSTAMKDRLLPIYLQKENFPEWLDYAKKHDVHPLIIEFLKKNTGYYYYQPENFDNDQKYLTPRRWVKFSDNYNQVKEHTTFLDYTRLMAESYIYDVSSKFVRYVKNNEDFMANLDLEKFLNNFNYYYDNLKNLERDKVYEISEKLMTFLESNTLTKKMIQGLYQYVTKILTPDIFNSLLVGNVENKAIMNNFQKLLKEYPQLDQEMWKRFVKALFTEKNIINAQGEINLDECENTFNKYVKSNKKLNKVSKQAFFKKKIAETISIKNEIKEYIGDLIDYKESVFERTV